MAVIAAQAEAGATFCGLAFMTFYCHVLETKTRLWLTWLFLISASRCQLGYSLQTTARQNHVLDFEGHLYWR